MTTLGVGVVGAGLWGQNHAKVFSTMPEARLLAVCDSDPARAEAMVVKYGGAAAYACIDDLLRHPGVEAVSIATPDFAHADLILAALAAGKHVLSEKPLATTVEEAERVHAAVVGSSSKFMVDFHNRLNPPFVEARRTLQSGGIGRPVHAWARLSNTLFVPTEMLSWAARSSALWFLGSHLIDILRFVLSQEIVRVYSVKRRGHLEQLGVATDDAHLSTLEFSGGTVAQIENSWVHPKDGPMVYDFKMEIYGTDGAVQVDASHHGAFRKLTGQGLAHADMFGIAPTSEHRFGGFVLEAIAHFVDAVVHDAPVLATVDDGLAVTRVLAALEESARIGAPVGLATRATTKGSD